MDGIVGLDTNLEIFAWNPTMERLTGIAKERILGKSILALFPASKVYFFLMWLSLLNTCF